MIKESELPVVAGIDWEYAKLHLPDVALLHFAVNEFYEMIEEQAMELEDLYLHLEEEGVLDSYCIRVHGMKSSATWLGIIPLAGLAQMLEAAAKNGDKERIHCLNPIFLEEWRSYKEKLQEVVYK